MFEPCLLLGVDSRKLGVVDCGVVLARLTPGFEAGTVRPSASGIKAYPLRDGVAAHEAVARAQWSRCVDDDIARYLCDGTRKPNLRDRTRLLVEQWRVNRRDTHKLTNQR